jgi:hypothetical protein
MDRFGVRSNASVISGSRIEFVGGGHFIDPGEPSVLAFVRTVLAG